MMTKPTSVQTAKDTAVMKVGELDWDSFVAETNTLIKSAIEPVQSDCRKLLASQSATEKSIVEVQRVCSETNERFNKLETLLKEHFTQLIAQTLHSRLDESQGQRSTNDAEDIRSGCGDHTAGKAGSNVSAQAGSMLAGHPAGAVNSEMDTISADSSTTTGITLLSEAAVQGGASGKVPDVAYMNSSDQSASPEPQIKSEDGLQPDNNLGKRLPSDVLNVLQTGGDNYIEQTAERPNLPPARKPTKAHLPREPKTPGMKTLNKGKVVNLKPKKNAGGTASTVKGGIISKKRKPDDDKDDEDGEDEEKDDDNNNEQLSDDSGGADEYDPKKDKKRKDNDDEESSAGGAPGNRRSARVKDKDTSKPSEKSKQSADAAEQRQKKGASKTGSKRCKGAEYGSGSDLEDLGMFDADVDEPPSLVNGAYVSDAAGDWEVTIFPAVLTAQEEWLGEEDMLNAGPRDYPPTPVEV